ncbi:MAG: DUF434 domain-containing protein [Phycisphaerales bacterium]|nr:MAG: DUF434 domain-containing protein [Phycisphaerales bacterium]
MPDRRKHRGKHPADEVLFAEDQVAPLRTSVVEYSWLLTRGYAEGSALKLVGDRYNLTSRQRLAIMRSACSDQSLKRRSVAKVTPDQCRGTSIGIDGYNLLITVESALSGGLVLVGRDGCYRDLASVHGTYRKVEETVPALDMIIDYLDALDFPRVDWYLDRPVSNSARLKTLMAGVLEDRTARATSRATWNIELVGSPDRMLVDSAGVIATSDSAVLDRCSTWLNVAAELIGTRIPGTWKVDLRTPPGPADGD